MPVGTAFCVIAVAWHATCSSPQLISDSQIAVGQGVSRLRPSRRATIF
jgi:hypothetical protein